jgi:hypothetical protein
MTSATVWRPPGMSHGNSRSGATWSGLLFFTTSARGSQDSARSDAASPRPTRSSVASPGESGFPTWSTATPVPSSWTSLEPSRSWSTSPATTTETARLRFPKTIGPSCRRLTVRDGCIPLLAVGQRAGPGRCL